MYAKVSFTVDKKANALVIPTAALVDLGGNKGVFMASRSEQGQVANFKKVDIGIVNQTLAEVTSGLTEGETVVTTGAAALREGDRILLPGETAAPGGRRWRRRARARPGRRWESGRRRRPPWRCRRRWAGESERRRRPAHLGAGAFQLI